MGDHADIGRAMCHVYVSVCIHPFAPNTSLFINTIYSSRYIQLVAHSNLMPCALVTVILTLPLVVAGISCSWLHEIYCTQVEKLAGEKLHLSHISHHTAGMGVDSVRLLPCLVLWMSHCVKVKSTALPVHWFFFFCFPAVAGILSHPIVSYEGTLYVAHGSLVCHRLRHLLWVPSCRNQYHSCIAFCPTARYH